MFAAKITNETVSQSFWEVVRQAKQTFLNVSASISCFAINLYQGPITGASIRAVPLSQLFPIKNYI